MNASPVTPADPDPESCRFGLSRAIQIHSDEFRAKNPRIKLDLDLVEDENLLPPDACLALYRVYLERLQQIAREAQAKQIWIHYYPTQAQMVLDIKNDGRDDRMLANAPRMRECLAEVGGELLVTARPDGGTMLSAKVPFRR